MKQKLLTLFAAAIFISISSYAKIWRVNNMPGVTADFTTAQAAHDGASAGDTIHLEPSVNNYGGVTCTKKLVWLSIGNFLVENPGKQFSATAGTVGSIAANAGSQGSVFSVSNNNSIIINTPNITVFRTYTNNNISINAAATNCVVSQSFCYYLYCNSTGAIISNNIMQISAYMSGNTASAIITNNVFNTVYPNNNVIGNATFYNAVYQNNITVKGGPTSFNNSTVSYNMCNDASFPAGNNNQLNVNMANVFVNSTGTADKDFQLKAGSPAIAAGYGGIDLGAFGGSTPFVLALQPAIPAITNLSSPSSTNGNTIQVTFSAKSNN